LASLPQSTIAVRTLERRPSSRRHHRRAHSRLFRKLTASLPQALDSLLIRYPQDRSELAVVLGCGDVGSAIAVALRRAALSVVLIDDADPPWHRRGMAFTDAWYVGNAELDGESACFCASLKSIPSVLARGMIAATTWSWHGVAAALAPAVIVDARARRRLGNVALRGRVPLSIAVGSALAQADAVDVAIDVPASALCTCCDPDARDCGPLPPISDGTARIVRAERHGRFMTERRIGDRVDPEQIVGALDKASIKAPMGGILVGVAARGARIEPGDPLAEIDAVGEPSCGYGIAESARRIANRVAKAVERHRGIAIDAPARAAVIDL